MKNTLKLIVTLTLLSATATLWANAPTMPTATNAKIAAFMAKETPLLSKEFPYRINLPKNGQIAQNTAGIRIAEQASQLLGDNSGQLFYYDLYDHAMRVPHWHANATEMGVVLEGKMRITIWEGQGPAKTFTVEKNGTWQIPAASLHVLENIGTTNLKFLVDYNVPNSADRDFVTAWAALPDAMLESSVGLTPSEIAGIKKTTEQRLRLAEFDQNATPEAAVISSPLSNNFSKIKPLYNSSLGTLTRIDATNTPTMQDRALQQTILKPGSMREPHWYTGGDDLFYVYKGSAFFMMMDDNGKVYNTIVNPGDLVFIPVGTFHTYLNIGSDDLEVYEAFNKVKDHGEVSLLGGAQHILPTTLIGSVGISKASAQKIQARPVQNYIIAF